VRIQPINTLRDVLGTKLPQGSQGWSYESAMAFIAEQGRGLVVMLGGWESPEAIMRNIAELAGQAEVEAPPRNYRVIGTGAQILRHLGVTNMNVMSAPIKFNAISGFQLEVSGFIPRPPQ
jgi:3,4-dihydroxy 2-butanone 4-phosphate synthase/GTP cyclohydrolase II